MALRARFYYIISTIVCALIIVGFVLKKESSIDYNLNDVLLQSENLVPVVIIGSGPSGLSAALYVARAGIKALVFAGPTPCGQLTQTSFIENWPGRSKILGIDLMRDLQKQAESFGALLVHDSIVSVDFSTWPYILKTEEGRQCKALSVIIATGATPKILSIPGEQEFWGTGVTTCAVCDAYFFAGKDVVVVGGGDTAIEEVFELAPYAKNITMLVRGKTMRAAKSMQNRLQAYEHVTVEFGKELQAIYGQDGMVTSIDVYDNQSKQLINRPIDGVFLAIGHTPNTQLFKDSLKTDEAGYIIMSGRGQKTSVPGVFVAGEAQDSVYRQAVVAAAEGVKAALDASSFLYELGLTPKIGKMLESNFFETFSDEKIALQEINSAQDLQKNVLDRKGLVVVDFYAQTCPGCIKMLPVLESFALKMKDSITIVKSDINNSPEILYDFKYALGLRVQTVPSLFVFKDGEFVGRSNNLMNRKEFSEFIASFGDEA